MSSIIKSVANFTSVARLVPFHQILPLFPLAHNVPLLVGCTARWHSTIIKRSSLKKRCILIRRWTIHIFGIHKLYYWVTSCYCGWRLNCNNRLGYLSLFNQYLRCLLNRNSYVGRYRIFQFSSNLIMIIPIFIDPDLYSIIFFYLFSFFFILGELNGIIYGHLARSCVLLGCLMDNGLLKVNGRLINNVRIIEGFWRIHRLRARAAWWNLTHFSYSIVY